MRRRPPRLRASGLGLGLGLRFVSKLTKRLLLAPLLAALFFFASAASARPGGGSSFHGASHPSGGGSHPSGGGFHPSPGYTPSSGGQGGSGGGGGGLVFLAFIAFFLVVPILIALSRAQRRKPAGWSTSAPEPPREATLGARRDLEAIQGHDPGFSLVLFEDFIYALYAEVHTARGNGKVSLFSAYLAPAVLAQLAARQGSEVRDVVVGGMRFLPAPRDGRDNALVQLETNYTEGGDSYYVRETWLFSRAAGAKSRTPERARVFTCPSCGAAQDAVVAGTCSYCKQVVSTGAFDWVVTEIRELERTPVPPLLTGDAPEEGTDLPTRLDPDLDAAMARLKAKDPAFDLDAFQRRVGLVFTEFQAAWRARDLARMRPYMSDGLFDVETYWVRTYLKQKLVNVTEGARILRLEPARLASDAYYDAITVRLFAESLDYTVRDSDGAVVGGSRTSPRSYSEYWTFIRGAAQKGQARAEAVCPSCGAALKVNMAGACEYCQAHVTRGEFDWVLSRIEQDEAYEG